MITLEISSSEIRLMETEGGKVIKWASRAIEPTMFEDGVIADRRALSTAVREVMRSSGINGRDVTASVSGLYSLSRIVMVPTPPGETVAPESVLDAAREVIPLSEEELYLSWQTIATADGGQQVLVLGVPRDVIDNEVQALRAAGINPRILDIKALALARAVNREQALILNIESASFEVVVVVNGVTEVMRTTAWQPDDFSLEDKAEHLAVALELTVGFYDSHHVSFPLDPATPLFVTGQMSGDSALMGRLQARIGYPLAPLVPPLKYPAHLPVSQYAVNIGLALKGTASSKNPGQGGYALPDINLLPQVYRPWKPTRRQIYSFLGIVAAVALLFPLYQVTTDAMARTAGLATKYATVNSELERRQVLISEREPLQKAIGQYNTILAKGGGLTEDLQVITTTAEELGVEVQSISHDGGRVTFRGQADSRDAFIEFITALEASGRFFTPVIPPTGYPWVTGGSIVLKSKPGG
ncbi:MAG: pilus assembly protein PilM [Chloroflexi bacterium]|nr:pilus assembly protein PilM [Chloroflexota bacterium]